MAVTHSPTVQLIDAVACGPRSASIYELVDYVASENLCPDFFGFVEGIPEWNFAHQLFPNNFVIYSISIRRNATFEFMGLLDLL